MFVLYRLTIKLHLPTVPEHLRNFTADACSLVNIYVSPNRWWEIEASVSFKNQRRIIVSSEVGQETGVYIYIARLHY
jgi:hypothetical protein